jgi:hypothetical protein
MKMITGDDIIAVIVDETDTIVEVEHPFRIRYDHSLKGAILVPYCGFTDDHNFRFKNETIMTISKASEAISNHYLELTDQYSEYLEAKSNHSIEDLQDLLDELGIDSYEDELEENLSTSKLSINIKGNDTKH